MSRKQMGVSGQAALTGVGLIAPVACTKLMVPQAAASAFVGARFHRLLQHGTTARLTLVCAAAGYGKTMLLATVARHAAGAWSWYSIDEFDANPQTFLLGVSYALAPLAPGIVPPVQVQLTGWPDRHDCWRPAADALINTLAQALGDPASLILDDYHLVDDTPTRHVVAYLCERLPSHCRLLIASRGEPSFTLARLRAMGLVCDISTRELTWQADDVAALLRQRCGEAPNSVVADLLAATDGWPLGVQLLLSERQRAGAQGWPGEIGTGRSLARNVDEFFTVEILRHVPVEVVEFLLHSCLLDQFSLDLLEAGGLVDREAGLQALTYLRNQHLFVVALDDEGAWYRYHPLFAQALRRLLYERGGSRGVRQVHAACATGCVAVGAAVQAVAHYLAAGEAEHVADLVEQVGPGLLAGGAVALVSQWLDQLPASLRARPALALLSGSAAFHLGDLAAALRWLHRVPAETPMFGQALWLMICTLGNLGSNAEAWRVGCFALQRLGRDDPYRADCAAAAAAALDHLNRFDEATALYRQAQRSPHPDVRAFADVFEATFNLLARGHLSRAVAQAAAAVEALRVVDPRHIRIYALMHLAGIYLDAGDFLAAASTARCCLEAATEPGQAFVAAVAQVVLARIALYQDDLPEASRRVRAAEELWPGRPLAWRPYWLHAVRARLSAQAGDDLKARAEMEQALALVRDNGFRPEIVATILEVMPDLPGYAPELVWSLLDEALSIARQIPNPLLEARVLLRMAAQSDRGGWSSRGPLYREAALALCEERGYPRFLSAREPLLSAGLSTSSTGPLLPFTMSGRSAGRSGGTDAAPEASRVPPREDMDNTVRGLTIRTLGGFALYAGGEPVEVWHRPKVREVFLYLVTRSLLAPRQPTTRDELIEVFWPGLAVHAAESSLSSTLSRLRAVIDGDHANGQRRLRIHHVTGGYLLRLGPDDHFDAAVFLSGARKALTQRHEPELRRAAEVYGGAYLPELRYADWTTAAREHVAQLYLSVLEALADGRAEQGDWGAAIEWAQRLLAAEPSHEAAHRRLMTYYLRIGLPDLALRQYRLCRAELLRACGVEPSAETSALYRRLSDPQVSDIPL